MPLTCIHLWTTVSGSGTDDQFVVKMKYKYEHIIFQDEGKYYVLYVSSRWYEMLRLQRSI